MELKEMDETLDTEDIGHLLVAKGRKLEQGEGDPDEIIRDVMETLARSEYVRSRERRVDTSGRVSVGRDMSGVYGFTLFHADPTEDVQAGDGDE